MKLGSLEAKGTKRWFGSMTVLSIVADMLFNIPGATLAIFFFSLLTAGFMAIECLCLSIEARK